LAAILNTCTTKYVGWCDIKVFIFHSTSDMPATKAVLVQRRRFHATSKSCTLTSVVAEIAGQGCAGGRSIDWNNERLQVYRLGFRLQLLSFSAKSF